MGTFRTRYAALFASGCLVATGLVAFTVAPASAATTFTVDTADDTGAPVPANCTTPVPGACGFNDAIAAAEAAGGAVTISLAVPGGVVNSTGDDWTGAPGDTLTIEGNGQSISTTLATQVVRADTGGHLTINNVTLESGYTTVVVSIPVTITNSTLTAVVTQTATAAQGVIADVDVAVSNTTITARNESDGAATGIESDHGPVIVTNSTITATSTQANANAIRDSSGATSVTGSTVTATGPQGGTGILGNGLTVVNSTIANSSGNGIDVEGPVTLIYSDVVGNAQLEGSYNLLAGTLTVFGSVIAEPGTGNANCSLFGAGTTSQGYNFSDDPDTTSSCQLANPSDKVGSTNNPLLGVLANNGGPTPTLLPLAGSPLIDAIPSAACQSGGAAGVTTDQRGLPRPGVGIGTGPNCDIGAVELQGTPAPTPIAIQPAFTG
jgi:hypothetical protein